MCRNRTPERGAGVDAGNWLTLVSILSVVGIAVFGGILRLMIKQIDEVKRERDNLRASYEAKLEIAEHAVEAKSETVAELRRQVDRYQITAEIQDKFFKQLPPPSSGQ